MNRDDYAKQPRKAKQAYNIRWTQGPVLDKRYALADRSNVVSSTETGLLEIFEIIPNSPDLPRFRGRWDEKADSLDIDLLHADERMRKAFEAGRPGYIGHRAVRVPGSSRAFEVKMAIPGIDICVGMITLNLLREQMVGGSLGFH